MSAEEVSHSLCALIYYVQKVTFSDEISNLAKGVLVSKNLRRLDPFIDRTGLIRVGGRLTNADIPYEHKHPVLLPSKHRLIDLLIDHHHHHSIESPWSLCPPSLFATRVLDTVGTPSYSISSPIMHVLFSNQTQMR